MSRTTQQEMFSTFAAHVKRLRLEAFDDDFPNILVPLAHQLAIIRREQQAVASDDAYRAFVAWSIPVWEAMHLHTSLLAPLASSPRRHALLMQLLGYVYPDAGDKRCFYRPLCLAGDATEAPGHLHVPRIGPSVQMVTNPGQLEAVAHGADGSAHLAPVCSAWKRVAEKLMTCGWQFEQEVQAKHPPSMAQLRDICRGLETVLRGVVVVATTSAAASRCIAMANEQGPAKVSSLLGSGATGRDCVMLFHRDAASSSTPADSDGTESLSSMFSIQTFRHLLTYTILVCHRLKETADFAMPVLRVLADTEWLRRTTYAAVAEDQHQDVVTVSACATHANVFGDLLELWRGFSKETRSCLPGEAGLTPAQHAANAQWRQLAMPQGAVTHVAAAGSRTRVSLALHTTFNQSGPSGCGDEESSDAPPSGFTLRCVDSHKALVMEDIPMEQRFSDDGECSHLRDTDRLVRFLRSAVRLPMIRSHEGLFKDLVLNRKKRSREATGDNEGRVLLPTTQSLGDVLLHNAAGAGGAQKLTPQERIVLRFAAS